MIQKVLVIGGYGNFGRFISQQLARNADIQILVGGRDLQKARAIADTVSAPHSIIPVHLDIRQNLAAVLQQHQPRVVIHTSGPFQGQGYDVARACIAQGCHYIDLADARDFVRGIHTLDSAARGQDILVCSGASSVPCLSSAIIDHYRPEFQTLENVEYAISTAQKTSRGQATTAAVLSYAGKSFTTLLNGKSDAIFGWQDLRMRRFWGLGWRLLGNCDIPDLALFSTRYPDLRNLRFQAGLELKAVHFVLFALTWLVRGRLLRSLQPLAPSLLNISRLLDPFGSDSSGFYMQLTGENIQGKPHSRRFDLVAHNGDGMLIPCIPAILLAQKLVRNEVTIRGARPCMGLITLDEYLAALDKFDIHWRSLPLQDGSASIG